jgi:hypothetical protein
MQGTAMPKHRIALRRRTVLTETGFFMLCLLKFLVLYKGLRKVMM